MKRQIEEREREREREREERERGMSKEEKTVSTRISSAVLTP